jgi:hypothetical protein
MRVFELSQPQSLNELSFPFVVVPLQGTRLGGYNTHGVAVGYGDNPLQGF